jgi:DNA mismatch endonuclease (patch repair protein)
MTDTLSTTERSNQMRLVKSKDTKPELVVRKFCRDLGFPGYRLHRTDLPGKPDVAFVQRKLVIFIHGCFWHGHACHGRVRTPKSNIDYWLPKMQRNIERDRHNIESLNDAGWRVLVVWECETKYPDKLRARLADFLA